MAAIHDLTARELTAAYAKRELSPVEVTRATLERVAAWEPRINAMYRVSTEPALAAASASEARWRAREPRSALDGVPITIKENIYTRGDPAPIGTRANEDAPAQAADAPPAARVREAGCVILGKTTMPDYGMLASGVSSLHGTTRNPWNTQRNTAGSSSGAGAGIAAGYGPLALGTDIGGSVRLPAAYNGIFALKPSLGRVPIYPPYLGRTTGPMTRTVIDSAMLMNTLTKPDARDFMCLPYDPRDWATIEHEVRGKRLGLLAEIGVGIPPQPAVRKTIEASAKLFEDAGAIVEPVPPFLTQEMLEGLDLFFQSRLLSDVERLPEERQAKILPFIVEWCHRADERRAVDALRALAQIMLMREKSVAAIQGYDFLISPTSPITAYSADEPAPGSDPMNPFGHIVFTAPFNMSEQPAASICAGYDDDGLPIGLQIVGHRFDDAGVMMMAKAYEEIRPEMKPWPDPK